LVEDFEINLALSVGFTGILKGIGQLRNLSGNRIAIREIMKTGGEVVGAELAGAELVGARLAGAELAGTEVAESSFLKFANRFGKAQTEEAAGTVAKNAGRNIKKKKNFQDDGVKIELKRPNHLREILPNLNSTPVRALGTRPLTFFVSTNSSQCACHARRPYVSRNTRMNTRNLRNLIH